MQNGVRSDVYEGEIQEKNVKMKGARRKKPRGREEKRIKRKGRKERKERRKEKEKEERFSRSGKEWIHGFGCIKEGRQRGSIRESYRYESCMLLPFLLCFSLPFMFPTSF